MTLTRRSGLKVLLPWELARTAIWDVVVWPGEGGTGIDTVLLIAVHALAGTYLVFRVAGTGAPRTTGFSGTTVIDGRLAVRDDTDRVLDAPFGLKCRTWLGSSEATQPVPQERNRRVGQSLDIHAGVLLAKIR